MRVDETGSDEVDAGGVKNCGAAAEGCAEMLGNTGAVAEASPMANRGSGYSALTSVGTGEGSGAAAKSTGGATAIGGMEVTLENATSCAVAARGTARFAREVAREVAGGSGWAGRDETAEGPDEDGGPAAAIGAAIAGGRMGSFRGGCAVTLTEFEANCCAKACGSGAGAAGAGVGTGGSGAGFNTGSGTTSGLGSEGAGPGLGAGLVAGLASDARPDFAAEIAPNFISEFAIPKFAISKFAPKVAANLPVDPAIRFEELGVGLALRARSVLGLDLELMLISGIEVPDAANAGSVFWVAGCSAEVAMDEARVAPKLAGADDGGGVAVETA